VRIKIAVHFDPTPDNTTASPQPGSCSVGDFLMANSTGTNWPSAAALLLFFLFHRRFFRWRSSVLKLKPRLRQNSICRMPLLINSATNCCTSLSGHPKPANEGHLKTGQRE